MKRKRRVRVRVHGGGALIGRCPTMLATDARAGGPTVSYVADWKMVQDGVKQTKIREVE